jgi:hypothetical protein
VAGHGGRGVVAAAADDDDDDDDDDVVVVVVRCGRPFLVACASTIFCFLNNSVRLTDVLPPITPLPLDTTR